MKKINQQRVTMMHSQREITCFKRLFHFLLLAIFLLLLFSCTAISAPRAPKDIVISIDQGYLSVNGDRANMPEPIEWWVERLGPYSRTYGNNRVCYIWDKLGISLMQDKPQHPSNIVIEFRETEYEIWDKKLGKISEGRNANENYPGTFFLNGIKLDEEVPLYEFNHRLRKKGGKGRFFEGSMPIKYHFTGLIFPKTNKTFSLSTRVDERNCIYRIEMNYDERIE